MSHEAYAELAAGFVLDALETEERSRFETHLASGCGECQSALDGYAETLATLVAELPRVPAPAAVRARLLDRLGSAPVARPAARPRWIWPALGGAALAAAAALVAYLGVTVGELRRELSTRAQEAATLRGEIAQQRDLLALLGAPDTRAVALAGLAPSPTARGRMWWNGDRRAGLFVASGLPPAPTGKTYQLWVISAGKPISAGTFPVDPRGDATFRVGPIPAAARAEVFAVTLEPAGGLPAPSGEMYLAGKST